MTTPNPGSREAIKLGCTCPIFDNLGLDGDFWITGGCPLHDKKEKIMTTLTEKEMREDFEKAYTTTDRFENENGVIQMNAIADFWLQKFSDYRREVREMVENKRKRISALTGDAEYKEVMTIKFSGYNQALSDILTSSLLSE